MVEKKLNFPGMVQMNFSVYADQISSGSISIPCADHTYVIARNNQLQIPVVNCTCYGIVRNTQRIGFINYPGDIVIASAMINGNFAIKSVYNDRLTDTCGIIYLLTGVCHQMTNRIIFTNGNIVMNTNYLEHVKGLRLSSLVYGILGRSGRESYVTRYHNILAMNNTQNLDGFSNEESYKDFVEKLVHEINRSTVICTETKEILRQEICGTATAESCLEIMWEHSFKNELKQEKISILKQALVKYVTFLQANQKLIEEYIEKKQGIFDEEVYSKLMQMVPAINEGFQAFNAKAVEILGKDDYKTLFGEDYEVGFVLGSIIE